MPKNVRRDCSVKHRPRRGRGGAGRVPDRVRRRGRYAAPGAAGRCASGRFEVMAPARRFAARKGQRHLPGLWWSSTVAGHVGYKSWLERDRMMWLDRDLAVPGIAPQPFWLSWTGPDGKDVAHAPDFFAR